MTIRVMIADAHEVVRAGVKCVLSSEADICVVGEAATAAEAIALAAELQPDVVLLDVQLSGNDGLHALGEMKLRSESIPVVVLSSYDNPAHMARAVAMGASGCLLKNASYREWCDTVRQVADGKNTWTRDELRRVNAVSSAPRSTDDTKIPLTRRETEVLRQLSHGLTNKEIAQASGISCETVKEHVQHILRKVGVVDRTQAAVWAVRKGLV